MEHSLCMIHTHTQIYKYKCKRVNEQLVMEEEEGTHRAQEQGSQEPGAVRPCIRYTVTKASRHRTLIKTQNYVTTKNEH